MARQTGLIQFIGTIGNLTSVNSRAYKPHLRKKRTVFTLGDEMKESSVVLKDANVYAKAFKDAIDPYRIDFRYGLLWQQLVSIFKKQLATDKKLSFTVLEGRDLHKINTLGLILTENVEVTQADNHLTVKATTRPKKNPVSEKRVNGYLLTIIAIFADNDLKTVSFSKCGNILLTADPGELTASFEIPASATTAIVVLKCDFSFHGVPLTLQKAMGMKVVKVHGVE